MLTRSDSAATPRGEPPVPPLEPPGMEAALLQSLDAIEAEDHILVLGKGGPDLMCVLLRAGATQVTHLCSHERPEADSASLAIVPVLPSLDWLASALPSIRRALHVNGRLVIAVTGPALTGHAAAEPAVRRILTLHGFSAIRGRGALGRRVLTAELVAFGLRRCG